MKSFATAAMALAGLAQSQNIFDSVFDDILAGSHKKDIKNILNYIDDVVHEVSDIVDDVSDIATSTKMSKNDFGCLVEESVFPKGHVEKTITAPLTPFHADYTQ